jgi:choline monooxygenase
MHDHLQQMLLQFDPERPLEQAATIPSSWYFDKDLYELERRAVFGDTWQLVGRMDQVAEPGSFFTTDVAGEPILVIHDDEGVLRAFYNVCRHRAARVALELEGQLKKLRCRYHGWTYDLAGRLRGTPEFEGVANFSRDENGLAPVTLAAWGPLVAVHLGQKPTALVEQLAPLTQRTAGLGLERLRFVERREYRLACNWKVYVDNFLDGGYHVNTIHPGLAGVLDYSQYRTEILGETSVQISPLKSASARSGGSAMGQVRAGEAAYYWWVFPNFMMNIYQGVMDTNLVLPLGPDACRVIFDFYFEQTEGAQAQEFIGQSIEVADQIQQEDMGICEDVQKGLASRSFNVGRFSVRREKAGYYFHQLLARRLRQAAGV